MKTLFLALLLTSSFAHATVQQRTLQLLCGTQADLSQTLQKYNEQPVIVATNSSMSYSVWANVETQTSTWILKTPEPDLYCVMGVGQTLQVFEPQDPKSKIQNKKSKKPQS